MVNGNIILTKSGGLVECGTARSGIHGDRLYLHIDQSTNVNNGEGDASIHLSLQEVKDLISILNNYIIFIEGKPFVVAAEPLMNENVKITVDDTEIIKDPILVNPYLGNEDIISPGESNIDYGNYFKSISKYPAKD